mmetsp:Transcript_11405/g.31836  ORF Transcript_11405/g.31836 Transcript_11405/m.31836 type:complete len:311 (-) Transcript_11405:452-1384(-)
MDGSTEIEKYTCAVSKYMTASPLQYLVELAKNRLSIPRPVLLHLVLLATRHHKVARLVSVLELFDPHQHVGLLLPLACVLLLSTDVLFPRRLHQRHPLSRTCTCTCNRERGLCARRHGGSRPRPPHPILIKISILPVIQQHVIFAQSIPFLLHALPYTTDLLNGRGRSHHVHLFHRKTFVLEILIVERHQCGVLHFALHHLCTRLYLPLSTHGPRRQVFERRDQHLGLCDVNRKLWPVVPIGIDLVEPRKIMQRVPAHPPKYGRLLVQMIRTIQRDEEPRPVTVSPVVVCAAHQPPVIELQATVELVLEQ